MVGIMSRSLCLLLLLLAVQSVILAQRTYLHVYTLCLKKRPPFYFSNSSLQKLTDFNDLFVC